MSSAMDDRVDRLMRVASERGIISPEQRDALRSLDRELALGAPEQGRETPRGFNAVTVAYVIGAMLIVFSSAWFLVDRWASLGPWGVLVVAVAYAALLLASSLWLERRAYRFASQVTLTLAVTVAALVAWSIVAISGLWPAGARSSWLDDSNQRMAVCWAVVDFLTLMTAGVAARWRPSVPLTIPMTVSLWGLWLHLSRAAAGERLVGAFDEWLFLAGGLMVCMVAGEVDRWQIRRCAAGVSIDGDYAFFFWLGGLIVFSTGYMTIWDGAGPWRHLMVGVALLLIIVSLLARRRTLLVFGFLALFGYLAYLAFEVFREFVSLPVVLGALGILLIALTVRVQRSFPALVKRVNAERAGRPLPGAVTRLPFMLTFSAALLFIPSTDEVGKAREERRRSEEVQRERDAKPEVPAPRQKSEPDTPRAPASKSN